jgi:hypothetical protein
LGYALQGYEGVELPQPFDTVEKSVSLGTSNAEYLNLNCVYPGPLATQVHEPQSLFLSEISHPFEEVSAEHSLSQSSLDFLPHKLQQPPPDLGLNISASEDVQGLDPLRFPVPVFQLSPGHSGTARASPISSSHISGDAPDGKREINSLRPTSIICSTCKSSFRNATRYSRHMSLHNCRAVSTCTSCKQSFKHLKDLKRHQGLDGSTASCHALKGNTLPSTHFACTCGRKSYSRKDSLRRHMACLNSRESSQRHRCKACDSCRCYCQPGRSK